MSASESSAPAEVALVAGGGFLGFEGEARTEVGGGARGSYAAPEGPAWGWRIGIGAGAEDLSVRIVDIAPDGVESIAVGMRRRRPDDRRRPTRPPRAGPVVFGRSKHPAARVFARVSRGSGWIRATGSTDSG